MAAEPWRHMVLELLLEWSQRSISAKALAEFAGRNPAPSLRLLVEAATSDAKENVLPPGFDRITKEAAERMDAGKGSVDDALEEIFQGLAACSDAELAVSTLGNVCSAGHNNVQFREHMLPFCEPLVSALARMLANLRLGGRAASALCNILRLGDSFSAAIADTCTEPLVKALRSETSGEGRPQLPKELQMEAGGLLPVGGAGRVLGALVNLLVVRPAAAQRVLELGTLGLVVPLIAPEEACATTATEDDGPDAAVSAEMLAARLLAAGPGSVPPALQGELARRLARVVQRGAPAAGRADVAAIERLSGANGLERAVRMLTVLGTKTPGGLERLTGWAPRVEELSEGAGAPAEPPVAFGALAGDLVKLALKVQPRDYLTPDEEGGPESRLRGNLALLFGALCEAQGRDGAPPALRLAGPAQPTLRGGWEVQSAVRSMAVNPQTGTVAVFLEVFGQGQFGSHLVPSLIMIWPSGHMQEGEEPLKLSIDSGPRGVAPDALLPTLVSSTAEAPVTLLGRVCGGKVFCWRLNVACAQVVSQTLVCESGGRGAQPRQCRLVSAPSADRTLRGRPPVVRPAGALPVEPAACGAMLLKKAKTVGEYLGDGLVLKRPAAASSAKAAKEKKAAVLRTLQKEKAEAKQALKLKETEELADGKGAGREALRQEEGGAQEAGAGGRPGAGEEAGAGRGGEGEGEREERPEVERAGLGGPEAGPSQRGVSGRSWGHGAAASRPGAISGPRALHRHQPDAHTPVCEENHRSASAWEKSTLRACSARGASNAQFV
ncbi:unnamed protein product [Prorocentrum cordatum]|uniref:Uncharacterized protein n=1 Tax=Prorocentrum cordatum TaxID=2364126 RepID=A0ABN9TDF9_9DINO|nr:unnamed protein product [Polarella glacialis]